MLTDKSTLGKRKKLSDFVLRQLWDFVIHFRVIFNLLVAMPREQSSSGTSGPSNLTLLVSGKSCSSDMLIRTLPYQDAPGQSSQRN